MTEPLARYLTKVFGRPGLVIHGGTAVKKRMELVDEFNGENYIPFMVLSIKAAGTGLNLTKASSVIHFDRWWNPAVEDQATDRAYRIGQTKNVTVYKFVSRGHHRRKNRYHHRRQKEAGTGSSGQRRSMDYKTVGQRAAGPSETGQRGRR